MIIRLVRRARLGLGFGVVLAVSAFAFGCSSGGDSVEGAQADVVAAPPPPGASDPAAEAHGSAVAACSGKAAADRLTCLTTANDAAIAVVRDKVGNKAAAGGGGVDSSISNMREIARLVCDVASGKQVGTTKPDPAATFDATLCNADFEVALGAVLDADGPLTPKTAIDLKSLAPDCFPVPPGVDPNAAGNTPTALADAAASCASSEILTKRTAVIHGTKLGEQVANGLEAAMDVYDSNATSLGLCALLTGFVLFDDAPDAEAKHLAVQTCTADVTLATHRALSDLFANK